MSFQNLLLVKGIQVSLRELGLYAGKIDGLWGKMTADGLSALCGNFNTQKHKGVVQLSLVSKVNVVEGVKTFQSNLIGLGLYKGAIDGQWSLTVETSFTAMVKNYRAACNLKTYDIAWSAKVPPAFLTKVQAWVAERGYFRGADEALMACMAFESAGTFSPSIQNAAGAQAFGLIQFMEGAAQDLGVPLEKIRNMNQLTQLDLVFKYFEMWEKRGKRYRRLEDFYLTIFYPAAVGMLPDQVLFKKDVIQYRQNAGFDFNKDGVITIGEISSKLYDKYFEGMELSNRNVLA